MSDAGSAEDVRTLANKVEADGERKRAWADAAGVMFEEAFPTLELPTEALGLLPGGSRT